MSVSTQRTAMKSSQKHPKVTKKNFVYCWNAILSCTGKIMSLLAPNWQREGTEGSCLQWQQLRQYYSSTVYWCSVCQTQSHETVEVNVFYVVWHSFTKNDNLSTVLTRINLALSDKLLESLNGKSSQVK